MTKRRTDEAHQALVDSKRQKRMATIDALPPDIRHMVHEYSYSAVKALMDVGVTKPNQIRHVVETILDEFSPTRGCYSQQGIRTEVIDHLIQEGKK